MHFRRNLSYVALLAALGCAPALAAASVPTGAASPALPPAFEDVDDVPLPDPDLWQRIRLGFILEALNSPLVAEHEHWYPTRPGDINRFVGPGTLYLPYIAGEVEKPG